MAEKEILVEITYHQVYGKPSNNRSICPMLIFYKDGTYTIANDSRWSDNDFSLWRIEGNMMFIKHTYHSVTDHEWKACNTNEGSLKINQIVMCELAIEKLLTGELGV